MLGPAGSLIGGEIGTAVSSRLTREGPRPNQVGPAMATAGGGAAPVRPPGRTAERSPPAFRPLPPPRRQELPDRDPTARRVVLHGNVAEDLLELFLPMLNVPARITLPGPGVPMIRTAAVGPGKPGGSIMPTALFGRLGGPIARGLGGIAAGVGIGAILQSASDATGRRVTRREIINAARHCGIEIAAQSFGLDVHDVCAIVAKGMPRRRRGISAADLRRTRSTLRKIQGMRKDLKPLCRA